MKRLVLCCDGTWNSPEQAKDHQPTPTNVIRTAYRVAKRDPSDRVQVTYYHPGVGTGNAVDKFTGGTFGMGLEENVRDAYRFLMANYETGDEIFLLGFSRGAYTARSIAGMIRSVGILSCVHAEQYPRATLIYHDDAQHPDDQVSKDFRAQFSVGGVDRIPIKCIGVWDTVGALGIPLKLFSGFDQTKYELFDTELSGAVEYAFQALAIDEHREQFLPTLWKNIAKENQTVEQVWFCGAHSDVGGGYAEDGLSNIALEWMLSRLASAGLAFDAQAMQAHARPTDPRGPLHDSHTGVFRLSKAVNRPMDATDSSQAIHESVIARWDAVPDYRPDNLRAWFKAKGDPRAEVR